MTQRIELPEELGGRCCGRTRTVVLFTSGRKHPLLRRDSLGCSDEAQFLLSQRQSDAGYHKNIAYRLSDRLPGYGEGRKRREGSAACHHATVFATGQSSLARQLLSPYAG